MNTLELETMPDLKRLVTQTDGKTVIRFPDRPRYGLSLFVGIAGLTCLILAMWFDKAVHASEFSLRGWAASFLWLTLAVGLLWAWMWFARRWVRVTITPDRLRAERPFSQSTLMDVAMTQVRPPQIAKPLESSEGKHTSFAMTTAGTPSEPEEGILISHAWGAVVVGSGLSAASRETLLRFLTEQLASCQRAWTDAAPSGSSQTADANASEATLTFVYGNPRHHFMGFLGGAALCAFFAYEALTNDRGLILNGAHFGMVGATRIYWIFAAVGLMGFVSCLSQWRYTSKHPRQLVLKPDGLDIYDKGTGSNQAIAFSELTNLILTTEEKNGSKREIRLDLYHPEGIVSIEREELINWADFETIRDWITNGYEWFK